MVSLNGSSAGNWRWRSKLCLPCPAGRVAAATVPSTPTTRCYQHGPNWAFSPPHGCLTSPDEWWDVPPPCTNCSQITLFEVSPAKSLSKGKTTSKCLQVCVGILYDAAVSMSTLLLEGGGGYRWMFKLKCSKFRIYLLEFAISPSSVAPFCPVW